MSNKELETYLKRIKPISLLLFEENFETLKQLIDTSHCYSKEEISSLVCTNEWLFSDFVLKVSNLVYETLCSLAIENEEFSKRIKFIVKWYSFISSLYASGNEIIAGLLLNSSYTTPLAILDTASFKKISNFEAVKYWKTVLLNEGVYSEKALSEVENRLLLLNSAFQLADEYYLKKIALLNTPKIQELENRIFQQLQLVSKSKNVLTDMSNNFVDRGLLNIEKRNTRSFNRMLLKLSPHKKRELKFQDNRIKRRLIPTRRTPFDSFLRFSQSLLKSRILSKNDESNSPFVKGAVVGIIRKKVRQKTSEFHNKWLHYRYESIKLFKELIEDPVAILFIPRNLPDEIEFLLKKACRVEKENGGIEKVYFFKSYY